MRFQINFQGIRKQKKRNVKNLTLQKSDVIDTEHKIGIDNTLVSTKCDLENIKVSSVKSSQIPSLEANLPYPYRGSDNL